MRKAVTAASAVAIAVGGLVPSLLLTAAGADPITSATASAYGANLSVAGTDAISKAGLETATAPPNSDPDEPPLLLVPVAPLAVSGTANGEASAHVESDLNSSLTQVAQSAAGPYNATAVGTVENARVLLSSGSIEIPGTALVSAASVRAEAVATCSAGTLSVSANSEIIDLKIGATDVPLNGPVTGLLDTLNGVLAPLNQVVKIARNEVSADGTSVNALRVTLLNLTGTPLAEAILGHAEVSGLGCANLAQCSDTQDNDGDGVIDANDPGCITNGVYDPNDDDERNECVDTIDNADPEDTIADFPNDPGCSSAQDDDETDAATLPRTGGNQSSTAPLALGLMALAGGAVVLRRRSQA